MAKKNSVLAAPSKALDPTLDALFASSAGPAKPPPKSRYVELLPHKSSESQELSKPEEDEGDEEDEEDGSVDDQLGDDDEDEDHSEEESGEEEDEATEILEAIADRPPTDRKRKRKNKDDDDELESKYLQKLVDNEEPSGKRQKGEAAQDTKEAADEVEDIDMSDSDGEIPVHESLAADAGADEVEKASRTVYLSNVSIEAIKSAKAKKVLLAHLESILDSTSSRPQTIESIRFRSLPFATAKLPKRAAYIKKSLMDATTKAANAYVVYSDAAGCRAACSKLNGTMVLDRHLRVDSVAHPAAVDHRRCVFVGNLGFVDDEAVLNTTVDEEGEEVTEKRKRTKAPMDVEEGLWRVFGKQAGKVENVRVVRDPVTRVGKGFAYVQFYDGTSVEAALLLAGKKFPPMLPRELRVTRCRAPQKTARALEIKGQRTSIASDKKKSTKYVPKPTAESQTLAGRAGKLFGRSGAVRLKGRPGRDAKRPRPNREQNGDASSAALKTPEQIVFEGRRASAKDGKPRDLKFKGSKAGGQKKSSKKNHATQRTQKWKSKQAEKK